MEGLISGPLADTLKRGRQSFNARFLAASRSDNPIDAADFQRHLADALNPIARSVARVAPDRTDAAIDVLYDLSLDLFHQHLLGTKAKAPVIAEAWRTLLPGLAPLLAREPARIAGSVTNALYNLVRTAGAQPDDWLRACAGDFSTSAQFLDYGAVLAWRCGLPHYRDSALEKAASLPANLAARALALPEPGIQAAIANLRQNPWTPNPNPTDLRIVATAGAFRGFGGQFLNPPRVDGAPGDIVATDPDGSYRIYADLFNALVLRCEPQPPPLPGSNRKIISANAEAQIAPDGTLRWLGYERSFPELARATGLASSPHTVAVTIPTPHHIFLVGLA